MNTPPPARAVILLAHGSRDPLWRQPIEAVASRLRTLASELPVACAYIELTEPTLEQAADQLVQQGARQLTVFPLFLGMGKHAREDVPLLVETVRRKYPELDVRLLPSAGENADLIDTLAHIALAHT